MDLETIQSKATLAFLAKQGFNRHMPREIVFAPTVYQGLGFRHLYDLQGSDSTRLLLQEINQENSMTQKMLLALLDTIQQEAGIGTPILENCQALEYIEWGWIPQIRDFLWHAKGKIIGATQTPKTYRINDSCIMDSKHITNLTRWDKIYIHRCRLFLQVETVSDIATADGQRIHEAWKHAQGEKPSRLLTRWPRQQAPHDPAWKAWGKLMNSFCSPNGMLHTPLGAWITNNETRLHTAYFDHEDQSLWIPHEQNWYQHTLKQRHRQYLTFYLDISNQKAQRPPKATPIDIIEMDPNRIKTTTAATTLDTAPSASQHVIWYQRTPEKHNHMTGNISLLVDDHDLPSLFQDKAHIDIASDGGHDPKTGISTFGWAVSVNKLLIAKGRGPAQAHPRLA
jgi:hypothetical protein